MNELDLTTKIEGLKKAIAEHKDFAGNYESDLAKAEQELKDYNKPELTASQLDDIQEAIERGIENFDFSNSDNYEIEYGIDYDGKVHCENIDLQETYGLTEIIVKKVHALFVEASEEEPTNEQLEQSVASKKPSEKEIEDFNKKIEETKDKKFKKRTWF